MDEKQNNAETMFIEAIKALNAAAKNPNQLDWDDTVLITANIDANKITYLHIFNRNINKIKGLVINKPDTHSDAD